MMYSWRGVQHDDENEHTINTPKHWITLTNMMTEVLYKKGKEDMERERRERR